MASINKLPAIKARRVLSCCADIGQKLRDLLIVSSSPYHHHSRGFPQPDCFSSTGPRSSKYLGDYMFESGGILISIRASVTLQN